MPTPLSRRTLMGMAAAVGLGGLTRPARAAAGGAAGTIVRTDFSTLPPYGNGALPAGIRSRHIQNVNGMTVHILEADGLISVRRGNVGGAVVHLPSAERTAHMISMVLQSRSSTPADVSGALLHLEPICAGMCAARVDRMTEVVPYLEAEIELQTLQFDDLSRYVPNARRFHEAIVSRCGNEPMILLIGSLELIWSAHESSVWSDEGDPMSRKTMRAALRDHQRLLDAIRDGDSARAVRLAQDHLAAARRNTLAVGSDKTIEAKLISSSNHQESLR